MSILDELKAKSIKAQAEADAAVIKEEQETKELMNKLTQFLLNKVANNKSLERIINESATKNILNRVGEIYVCFAYQGAGLYEDIVGGKFYISGSYKNTFSSNIPEDEMFSLTKDECRKLGVDRDFKLQQFDKILIPVAKEIYNRLTTMGFTASIQGGPCKQPGSAHYFSAIKFAW